MNGFVPLAVYELSSILDITHHSLYLEFPPVLIPKTQSPTFLYISSISPSILSWTLSEAPLLIHLLRIGVLQTTAWVISSHHLHSPWKTPAKPLVSLPLLSSRLLIYHPRFFAELRNYIPKCNGTSSLEFPTDTSNSAYTKVSLSISSPKSMFPSFFLNTQIRNFAGLQQLLCAPLPQSHQVLSTFLICMFPFYFCLYYLSSGTPDEF